MRNLTDQPEFNIVTFAFLLNYPWEFLQVPLYLVHPGVSHWDVIKTCSIAAVGDALIMLVSYWTVAIAARARWWILRPAARQLLAFVAVGIIITIGIEYFATGSDHPALGWRYAPAMPVLPLVHVGLAPLLQWLVLPPLAVWFVRRQLSNLPRNSEGGG